MLAQVFALWWMTGRAGLTRYHDPRRAVHERRAGAVDLLLDDAADEGSPFDRVPNSFALGLLPYGLDRHALSVTTLAIPAIALLLSACFPARVNVNSSEAP
jgi:hypothetical protein